MEVVLYGGEEEGVWWVRCCGSVQHCQGYYEEGGVVVFGGVMYRYV